MQESDKLQAIIEGEFANQLGRLKQQIFGLPHGNGKLLLDWEKDYRYKGKTLGNARKIRWLTSMKEVCQAINQPLMPITSDKIIAAMNAMQKRKYGLHTLKEFSKDLKVFIHWKAPEKYISILAKTNGSLAIQNPYSDGKHKLSKADIISEEQFLQMLEAADSLAKKAVLAILFGLGVRRSELRLLKRDSLQFNEDGTIDFSVFGKTGFRTMPLQKSLGRFVKQHYDNSPQKQGSDFLFCNKIGKILSGQNLNVMLWHCAIRANLGRWQYNKDAKGKIISKKYVGIGVNCIRFRRSHITWCLLNMNNATAKRRAWGNEASAMVKVYSAVSDADSASDYNLATGAIKAIKKESVLSSSKTCAFCQYENPFGVELCQKCGMDLNPQKVALKLQKENERDLTIKKMQLQIDITNDYLMRGMATKSKSEQKKFFEEKEKQHAELLKVLA